jgi:hemerythrin-like metal-binding protein
VRESDTVARWGGEEFVVIAPMTNEAEVASLAEKLRSIMATSHLGPKEPVTASFGVAELKPDDTVETLLHRADGALYQAKQSGRNRVCRAEQGRGDAAVPSTAARKDEAFIPDRMYTETGFGPMDDEHQVLSLALVEFIRNVNSGKTDEVQESLDEVIHGVGHRFSHEEELMSRHEYPLEKRHAEAHASFVADTLKFQHELLTNGITPSFRRWAVERLPEWFRYHILAHDIGLGRFLIKVGAARQEAGAPRSVTSEVE